MQESILNTVKRGLSGIPEDYDAFDEEIMLHINTALSTLKQLGVKMPKDFRVEDEDAEWSDFLPEETDYEKVKDCITLKVKLVFDPPTSAAAIESLKSVIAELEWRIAADFD